MAENLLRDARTNDTSVVGQADAAAFEKVGHGGGGLVHVPAEAAYRDDEITEREVGPAGEFEGLFHVGDLLEWLAGWWFESSLSSGRASLGGVVCR